MVPVAPPFDEVHVTVYDVIGEPPLDGGVKVTKMDAFSAATVGCAGAAGGAANAGVGLGDDRDAGQQDTEQRIRQPSAPRT